MTLAFDRQARTESQTVAPPHQQPLPGAARGVCRTLRRPFDDVHVAPTAASQGADAMTVGGIAFGEVAYRPESGWSREHIAHELDRVVPQCGGTGGPKQFGQGGTANSSHDLQRTIGNQAVQRLLQSQAVRSGEGEASTMMAREAQHGASGDFSRIPLYSADRTSRPQPSSPLATAPLPAAMQAKLVVGQANDPLENEADHIADQVMHMPAPLRTASGATLQRKCAPCEEEERSGTLRAKHHGLLESSATEVPAIVDEVLPCLLPE